MVCERTERDESEQFETGPVFVYPTWFRLAETPALCNDPTTEKHLAPAVLAGSQANQISPGRLKHPSPN